MTHIDYESFKGISHIGYDDVSNILEANLKIFYDWSILQIGGWTDVQIPSSGAYGGDYSQLRCVDDPLYNDGQVWESARKDWVWETGVNYVDTTGGTHNPVLTGGLTINGTASNNALHANYALGRIIFDDAINTTDTVRFQYAYRDIQVYKADDAPWWKELQSRSYRVDDSHFLQRSSGNWSVGSHHRIQMPCIIIEVVPQGRSTPYELGNGMLNNRRDVLFHVLSETRHMRNNMMDWIARQAYKTIFLFNTNSVAASGDFPLDYRGMLVGTNQYSNFIDDHVYRRCYMAESTITDIAVFHPELYGATVRTTMEIVV